jgi:predicted AAA+ superfamily ATPase
VTWCFDEIQVVSGWERFARRVLDSENVEMFLSGSSARMLSREVATSMRGRAMETVIAPYSFHKLYLADHGLAQAFSPDEVTHLSEPFRAEGPSQYQPSPDAGAAQAEPAPGLGFGGATQGRGP